MGEGVSSADFQGKCQGSKHIGLSELSDCVQGTVKFTSIVKEFSKMLCSIPHDQAFTQLLISQIVTFYDKCFGWYKGNCQVTQSTL